MAMFTDVVCISRGVGAHHHTHRRSLGVLMERRFALPGVSEKGL